MKNIKMNKKILTIIAIILIVIILAFLTNGKKEENSKNNQNENIEIESTVATEQTEEPSESIEESKEVEQENESKNIEAYNDNKDSEEVLETAAVATVFKTEAEAKDYYDEIPYLITNEKGESYLANDFVQEIPEGAVEVDGHYEVTQKDGSVAIYEKTAKEYSITKLDTEDIYEPTDEKIILEYEGKQYDITQYIKEYYNGEPIIELKPVAEMIGWEFTTDKSEFEILKKFGRGTSYNADEEVDFIEDLLYFGIIRDDITTMYYTGSKTYVSNIRGDIVEGKAEYKPKFMNNKFYISLMALCLSENGPLFKIEYLDSEVIYKIN